MSDHDVNDFVQKVWAGYISPFKQPLCKEREDPVIPPNFLVTEPPMINDSPSAPEPARAALIKAGTLLVDLSDQATKLAGLLAEHPRARVLAGSLCRRAEAMRQVGRKLALFCDPKALSTATLMNDAILALDGVALDVEHAAELSGEVKIKNQVARSRLAVTVAGCAIDDARRASAPPC
jgi:hypothetical protein